MAARGLWIEMICLMHKATPYGHLLVNGNSPTNTQLAVLVGAPPDQVAALLDELEEAGVFSRTRAGVIFSGKMTRTEKKAATARKNGRKGGNPNLRQEWEKSLSDNLNDNGGDKPQKPEPEPEPEYSDTYVSGGAPPESSTEQVDGFAKALFDHGVRYLKKHGVNERNARAFIGKLRKQNSDEEVFAALKDASKQGVTDPMSWISARFQRANDAADVQKIMAEIKEQRRLA